MKPFIQFKDFTFKYDVQAEPTLKAIDLTIEKGQKVLIVGASGSGKSTIGHCLNGIIPNIHQGEKIGQLLIDGQDVLTNRFMINPAWFPLCCRIQMGNLSV